MKSVFKKAALIGSLAVLSVTAALAGADPVKERRELMENVGKSVGVAVKMIKGETAFDAAKAEEAMKTIAGVPDKIKDLFVDGTDMSKNEKSEASPKIWENKDDFAKKLEEMKVAATKAGEAAKGGKDGFATAFADVSKTCKTCHEAYRVKK